MQRTVIFLNGPPQCGKDHAARYLCRYHHAQVTKFAQPLRDMLCILLGCADGDIEHLKRVPINDDGMTGRDLMIHLSEDVVKPLFGKDWFGRRAAESIMKMGPLVVVSDCGFGYEAEGCMEALREQSPDVDWRFYLWRIKRPGHVFKDPHTGKPDSRGWVRDLSGTIESEIGNATDQEQFEEAIEAEMDSVLRRR